jgi:(1->4)-alpha-D-glucan 1-alpha-D-glucosylmutase
MEDDKLGHRDFVKRIAAYMDKAIHEAKVHTSWISPDPAYDEAIRGFVERVLSPANAEFLADFRAFQERINHYGMFNSLSQTLLKITSPGVADIYQGTELWDFSLVDPDNRRPIDYERRMRVLCEWSGQRAAPSPELIRRLLEGKQDGRIKLYVISKALACRQSSPGLFATGAYLPAELHGHAQDHIFGFSRSGDGAQAIVAVPRLLTGLISAQQDPLGDEVWRNTFFQANGIEPGGRWHNVFTDELLTADQSHGCAGFSVAKLLSHFPVALLVPANSRRRG